MGYPQVKKRKSADKALKRRVKRRISGGFFYRARAARQLINRRIGLVLSALSGRCYALVDWGDAAMRRILIAAVVLACPMLPALAQAPEAGAPPASQSETSPSSPAENVAAHAGRFSFKRVEGGFVRLDSQTGQVALCSARVAGWACEMAPEDRVALDKEIGRLQDEVNNLKQQLAAVHEPPPPRPPAELSPSLPPSEKSDDAARLREDMDRARSALENAWRRLVDMIVNFQKDMMRKG
jgi:hypothetical protein